jgi:hypothetical protein
MLNGRIYRVAVDTYFRAVCDQPFFTFGVCGLAGIFPDIDHWLKAYFFPALDWRFLHPTFLIIAGIVFCGSCAYFGGLLCWSVLRAK